MRAFLRERDVMVKIDPKLLDEMAEEEVNALLEGLKDPELRTNPQFLTKVRQFLKDNELKTTARTMEPLKKQAVKELPNFFSDDEEEVITFRTC